MLQADEVGLVLVAMAFSETRSAVLLNANNTRSTLKPVTGVVDISIYTLEGESQKVASDEPIFVTLVEKFLFRGSPGRVGGRVGVVSDGVTSPTPSMMTSDIVQWNILGTPCCPDTNTRWWWGR